MAQLYATLSHAASTQNASELRLRNHVNEHFVTIVVSDVSIDCTDLTSNTRRHPSSRSRSLSLAPADSPFIERQRQQPGSCVASTRQPSHPQRVGFASESASNLCEQVKARCADFGPRAMELGRGLRASLRLAVRRSSSIVACRLREFRMTNLLWCVGEQCAGRRGRQWPHTAIGKPSRTRRRTQTLLSLVIKIALRRRLCGAI